MAKYLATLVLVFAAGIMSTLGFWEWKTMEETAVAPRPDLTVWRYQFEVVGGRQAFEMPKGAKVFRCAFLKDGRPCIWALVNPEAEKEARTFVLAGTGHSIKEPNLVHIGTLLDGSIHEGATYVWHVFEVPAASQQSQETGGFIFIDNPIGESMFVNSWHGLAAQVLENAKAHGFDSRQHECIGLALMHSELSEALEGYRDNNPPSEKLEGFTQVEEELADLVIRVMDHGAARQYRIAEAVIAKVEYNKGRPDQHGGRRY